MSTSYHGVVVFVGEIHYPLFDSSYGLLLTCTRVGGWELWHRWAGEERLIGGEYHGKDFRIEVDGTIICKSDKEASERPEVKHE